MASYPAFASDRLGGLINLIYGQQPTKINPQLKPDTIPPWIDHRKVEARKDGFFIVDQGINQQTQPTFIPLGKDLLIDKSLFLPN